MVYPHISTTSTGKQRVKSSIYYTFPIYGDKAISALMGLTISSCNPTQEEDINKVVVEKVAPAEIGELLFQIVVKELLPFGLQP